MVLFTGGFDQALVAEYIRGGYLDKHIQEILDIYRPRRDAMAQAITEYFPNIFEFTVAQGGLFIWVSLKKEFQRLTGLLNMKELLDKAIKAGVSFVPGSPFFANSKGDEIAMRLNFSNQSEENIVDGVRMIGELLNTELSRLQTLGVFNY